MRKSTCGRRIRRTPVGAGRQAAAAGAVHHRARAPDDGRGGRRPRHHRAADPERRAQRLRDRGGEALSRPLRHHGPHSARRSEGGRSPSALEGTARHARRPASPSAASAKWLTDGTADWFWPAAEKAGVPVMFLAPGQLAHFARIAERHPQLTLIIDHIGMNNAIPIRSPPPTPSRSPNIPMSR